MRKLKKMHKFEGEKHVFSAAFTGSDRAHFPMRPLTEA